jgi:hypothetical protein
LCIRQDLLERSESDAAAGATLRDLEDQPFCLVDEFRRRPPVGCKRAAGNLVADVNQRTLDGAVAKDSCISPGVGSAGRFIGESREVFEAAGGFEFTPLVEVLGNGNDIAGTAGLDEVRNRREGELVILAVEIFRYDDVGNLVPGLRIEHQAANQ